MLKYNIKRSIFLVVVCTLYSCQQYHSMQMDTLRTLGLSSKNSGCDDYEPLNASLPDCVVILLHSKGRDKSETDEMKKALNIKLEDNIIKIIRPKSRHESMCLSVQVDKTYKEITSILSGKYGFSEYNPIKIHIFCFGEEAKLVAARIVKESRKNRFRRPEKWQRRLNIKTLSYTDIVEYEEKINIDLDLDRRCNISKFLCKSRDKRVEKKMKKFICKNEHGAGTSKVLIKFFKGNNFISDYIDFLKKQVAYNQCAS